VDPNAPKGAFFFAGAFIQLLHQAQPSVTGHPRFAKY
jgi:hypothetical protein